MALLKFNVVPKKNPQTGDFMYYAQKASYSNINDKALIERIAQNTAVPAGVVRAACDAIFDTIFNFVVNGHSVEFGDFMNFRPALRCKLIYQGGWPDENWQKIINRPSSYGVLGSDRLRLLCRVTWRPGVRELQNKENYEFIDEGLYEE